VSTPGGNRGDDGGDPPLVDDPSADFVALIEQAFDYVEKGMPI